MGKDRSYDNFATYIDSAVGADMASLAVVLVGGVGGDVLIDPSVCDLLFLGKTASTIAEVPRRRYVTPRVRQ